jgi:hypothetical protein
MVGVGVGVAKLFLCHWNTLTIVQNELESSERECPDPDDFHFAVFEP